MVTEVKVYETEKDVGGHMVALILAIAADAIKNKGSFSLGLSGGSAAKLFCEHVLKHTSNWAKWNILFCDERFVEHNDPESTYGYFKKHFFDKVPINEDQIIKINFSHSNVEDAAKDYEMNMKAMFGNGDHLPEIDVLLLGFGPDGHTCSLFPNHKLLGETRWVGSLSDSPKPPPSRITLTYPVINNAAHVIFVGCGQSKSEVVKKIMEGPSKDVPASLVRPKTGSLHWLLDKPAGNEIENQLKQSQEL